MTFRTPSPRPLSRRLSRQRDEILAHVNNPDVRVRCFDVVGDVGSGKSALLAQIAGHCGDRGLLVLNAVARPVAYGVGNVAQDRALAELFACADLIAEFLQGIAAYEKRHPESKAATSRATEALKKARNPQKLHHFVVNATTTINITKSTDVGNIGNNILNIPVVAGDQQAFMQELLLMLRNETEEALRDLAVECGLVILVDDVHLLDGTSVQEWLRALLRQVPTYCNVTTRRPGNDSWQRGQTTADRTLKIQNMTPEEVGEYLKDRQLAFTDEDARRLFDLTEGHGFAVAAWCDLALDAGAARFTELMDRVQQAADTADFISLITRIQLVVDQIPVDVLGYQAPLFALLTIAERVTPGLIAAALEGEAGQRPPEREAQEIFRRLATRRFISAVGGNTDDGIYLPRAITDVASRWLREEDPVIFRRMHSCAEPYERAQVDLDYELPPALKENNPLAAWSRFEDPAWIANVARWLGHAQWLDREQFETMKPGLVKIYLDAFWWWDDYLRSAATRRLGPALKEVATQQRDELWMNALEKFSNHWVSSWDEAKLREDPREWQQVLDAITALLSMFDLHRGRIPLQPELRRIYILLCNFYGKALWYSGKVETRHAEKAGEWLAVAALACVTQDNEKDEENLNGWIGSWALLRQAEIWSVVDPSRSRRFLDGLDKKAIDDGDYDLRVGIVMLIGDLQWRSHEFALALDAYSRAILISYTYSARQELRRQAPNLYTKELYAWTIRRVKERISELEQAGEFGMLDTALAATRQLFEPYWGHVLSRLHTLPETPRFELPVPPPYGDEIFNLENEYVKDMEHLAGERESVIREPNVFILPPGRDLQ